MKISEHVLEARSPELESFTDARDSGVLKERSGRAKEAFLYERHKQAT